MSNRVTKQDLTEAIHNTNSCLVEDGSICYLVLGSRNGYTAVDKYRINEDGSKSCQSFIGGGTRKECLELIHQAQLQGCDGIYPITTKKTKKQAKVMCEIYGINFKKPFSEQSLTHTTITTILTLWAKLTRYRMPKNANNSLAHYFFYHLQKLKNISKP